MNFIIAFYVHHHGSGHLMRALAIARHLSNHRVFLMGSALNIDQSSLDSHIELIELPVDTPQHSDHDYSEGTSVDGLHYAPLNITGIKERSAIMTDFFVQNPRMILIVDVSVEVTLLARLCGIPTIVMRQHGLRIDLPHCLAYQSASLLIAPFDAALETTTSSWIQEKTFYSGGFSRFPKTNQEVKEATTKRICILTGTGGSSLDLKAITLIAEQCPVLEFHVLGKITGMETRQLSNLTFHGHLHEIEDILNNCGLVIGNTGHNTVMEISSLNKRFIGIPEHRPFDEQLDKANVLNGIPGFKCVRPENISTTDWQAIISDLMKNPSSLSSLIDENALPILAKKICAVGGNLYH